MTGYTEEARARGLHIGLVPTMGYLHEGHLSLLKLLDGRCDIKAASIFVNPIQFGPKEDLSRYPRDEARDLQRLESAGCEVVFCPPPSEVYPDGFQTYVEVEELQKPLCGSFRPGHFRGVATVVLKLFNITGCRSAAFGLKDFQQAMVLRRMVNDLNVPVRLFFGEIIREPDGLAMSSRNVYLSSGERASALAISRALFSAREACEAGERCATQVAKQIENDLKREAGIRIEYVEVVDNETLTQVELIDRPSRVAVAVYVGKTRLIDNIGVGHPATERPI